MPGKGKVGVARVTRVVAHGDGDWAEVPAPLREAIVVALTQASTAPLRSLLGGGEVPMYFTGPSTPPPLTEEAVQSSIETFADAAWVREEAARSYAEFHNNLEAMHVAMRTQLRPVWRTAMQLHPDILSSIREELHLRKQDNIPDGIQFSPLAVQQIGQQESILDDVENTLRVLRNTSVRFAAHFLSDEEKISMGANPAYLRAPDIDRETSTSRSHGATNAAQRTPQLRDLSASSKASHRDIRTIASDYAGNTADLIRSPSHERHSHHHHRSRAAHPSHAKDGLVNSKTIRREGTEGSAVRQPQTEGTDADPLLEELRRQYQQRVRELYRHGNEGERRADSKAQHHTHRQGVPPQISRSPATTSSDTTSSRELAAGSHSFYSDTTP